jgi:hypothetical protein
MPAFPPPIPAPGVLNLQDLQSPETDIVAALLAVAQLRDLLTSNAGTPGAGEPAIQPRLYLGRAPFSTAKGKVTRPFIVIRRTGLEIQNAGGRNGPAAIVMYGPLIEVSMVSGHYHELIWMQNTVVMTLNQMASPNIRSLQFQSLQFGDGLLDDGSLEPVFSYTATFLAHQQRVA